MTKRILNSAELDEFMVPGRADSVTSGTRISKKFKNSLDSDEEDDEERVEKYNVLNPDEFEGQEESTIDYDGEIQITPFNMREELEEGYFDKEGTYIFKKNEEEVKDKWLDDIDWVKIKRVEGAKEQAKDPDDDDDDEGDELPELNVIKHYKQMVAIMEPNETVQKAIRRLGGSKQKSKKSRMRLKPKDNKDEETSRKDAEEEASTKDVEKLLTLTELASDLVGNGDVDIYEQTFEKLSFLVKAAEEPKAIAEDPLDMFGESFEEDNTTKRNGDTEPDTAVDSEVTWEFKWESKDNAPIYGPHSTNEMLQWVQEGYFSDGVYVRQIGKPDAAFYSSKRIDFELYL